MPQGHKSGRKTIMTRLMPLGHNPSTRFMPQGHKVRVYGNKFQNARSRLEERAWTFTSQRPQRFLNLHSIFREYLNDVSFEWPLFYYDSAIRTYSRVKFILRLVTHYKNPKAFLCWTCYPLLRLNLVTLLVLYFSPFRYQFYWLVYRSNVSVESFAQEQNIVVIFARRSPTLSQIRLDVAYLL